MDFTEAQLWAMLGVLLLIAEIVSTSFVFVFFSAGALVAALCAWAGVGLAGQLLAFSAVSLLTLALFRQKVQRWFPRATPSGTATTSPRDYVEFTGDQATVTETIPAGGDGRVFYRGTEWLARTADGRAVATGKTVVIQRMDGIRAIVAELQSA